MSISTRPRRRLSHALTIIVTALGLGLVAPAGPVGSTAAAGASPDCVESPADARSIDRSRHGADPNSVTAAEAAAMQRALQTRVRGLNARGVLDRRGLPRGGHHHRRAIRVKTYVHVITKADGTGGVTRQQVRDQMKVMNDGFDGRTSPRAADTPFKLVLKGVTYTANDDWHDWSYPEEGADTDDAEAKTALRRGGWKALNIYVAAIGGGSILGYATFPNETELALDGVVLLNESLPGGSAAPYNEGDTGTHEVGHWLGLYHTFENGCAFPGDYVRDTPYQLDGDNIFFCNESDDTCTQPGTDPVHNFMSYGDDPCLDAFTRGQSRRMTVWWYVFRKFR
jgi:hypothetical protein